MTAIARNGLSGLTLKVVVIALAALLFGFAPKAPPASAEAAPQTVSEIGG